MVKVMKEIRKDCQAFDLLQNTRFFLEARSNQLIALTNLRRAFGDNVPFVLFDCKFFSFFTLLSVFDAAPLFGGAINTAYVG